MKRVRFGLLVMTLLVVPMTSLLAEGKPTVHQSQIVSTEWLAAHLNDKSLVLLQVGEKDEYLAGHIPGAQFITIADLSTPRGSGLALELPAVARAGVVAEMSPQPRPRGKYVCRERAVGQVHSVHN